MPVIQQKANIYFLKIFLIKWHSCITLPFSLNMKWPFTGRNLLVRNQSENSKPVRKFKYIWWPKGILFSYRSLLIWNLFIVFAIFGVKIFVLLKRRQKWRTSCCQVHTVNTRVKIYVIIFQEMNKLQLHGLKYGCTNPKRSRSSGPSASPCLCGTCWCKRRSECNCTQACLAAWFLWGSIQILLCK